jgi:hypothetical protein
MSSEFGFTVRKLKDGTWRVHLPHSCDTWDIAGDGWNGVTHGEALAALRKFMAECVAAHADLMRLREHGHQQE